MSAISAAMRRVMTIPKDLLRQGFMPKRYDPTRAERYYDNTIPLSLEACITDQVIRGRVLPDLDLVSGTEDFIRLDNVTYDWVDQWSAIYRLSDIDTGGRTITSVSEVTFGFADGALIGGMATPGNYGTRSSSLLRTSRDILNAAGGTAPLSTAYVQLIGHNTVLVNDMTPRGRFGWLRCTLTNDPNLNNIKPAYHIDFGTLVLHAVKSYLYTNLVIEIDEGMLRGGQTIGRFREVLDSYADAEQMYIEELDRWHVIGILNDPQQMRQVIKLSLGIRPKM